MLHIGLGGLHNLGFGLLDAQVGDFLQLGGLLRFDRLRVADGLLGLGLALDDALLAEFDALLARVEALLAVGEAALGALNFAAAVAQFGVRLLFGFEGGFLRLQ